ncbi:hypothetical protein [Salibacterium halotolerans]|uniref:Uncharacterized protein n=1 Tax=Salibacterium halotolerans TaxID=1884432 RepID=A0A1I5S0L2_9BACI|nr:hypothetical protein [Salibacterium halotolerans]SFP64263.1 hypothetical protein SAMN05518683_1083 [Salibacterium halotolerans]
MCRDKKDQALLIPTINPMKVHFDSEKERRDFIDWAEGRNVNVPENMKEVREGVKRAGDLRKRGDCSV